MQRFYSTEIEKQMREMFNRLSEKDKRLYARVEVLKLSNGGKNIAQLFACSHNTILRGVVELEGKEAISSKRDKKAGGCRKQVIEK